MTLQNFKSAKVKKVHAIQMMLIFFCFILFALNGIQFLKVGFLPPPDFMMEHKQLYLSYIEKITVKDCFLSMQFYGFLLVGFSLSVFLPFLNPISSAILVFVCMQVPLGMTYFSSTALTLIPVEYFLLTILVLYIVNIFSSYYIEFNKKQDVMSVLGQYIPPDLAQQIIDNPEEITLDGESRHLTIFFSDLQNFTGISEQLNPKQLTRLLNEYFTAMTEVMYEHGATIDKYIGDSIMAFWGAPLPQKDHAQRAVLASLQMQECITRLANDFNKKGWPAPMMGIGINSGRVNVGNMGSKYRMAYTVIGDAVNLASRIETLTRIYQVPTLITEQTKKELTEIVCREIDTVTVKGKHSQTKIYQPIGLQRQISEDTQLELKKQQIALNFYYDGNWVEAKKRFHNLHQANPDPYYQAMILKINEQMSY